MIIEGWSLINSFYMAVITLTTVGFGEVEPMSPNGRIFSVMLIFGGVTVLAYGASSTVEYMVSGKALQRFTERQRREMMTTLNNHLIVVGFGRVGREVALNFKLENIPFVVIDNDPASIAEATELGFLTVEGTATEDDVMREAKIEQAKGVVAAAGDDAVNVYVVLTARGLNENLFIIARATDSGSEAKLLRAGADRVTSPYVLSGRRMSSLALRPHVVDFLDFTSKSNILDHSLEEIIVEDGAIIANKTIAQIDLRRRAGANILAIYDANGNFISNPSATTILEPGTRLILLGTDDQLSVTEALARNFTQLTQQPDGAK
jgi:voltage-gated potassium channel